MTEKRQWTREIENKIKLYTNAAHPDFSQDPEYDMTWDEQFEEFKKRVSRWLAIGDVH